MKTRSVLSMRAGVLCLVLAAVMAPAGARAEDGWTSILNVKDLSDWKMVGRGEFKVEGDCLVTSGGMGLFWYQKAKIGNAEIRVVFKTERPQDNSGVFVRIDGEPKDPWFAVHHGYEVQIDSAGDSWHRTGSLYSLTEVKEKVETKPGEWTTMMIRLEGDRTVVTVNGTLVTDFKEGQPVPPKKAWYEPNRGPRPASGYIGLQNHDPASRVHFKEIAVRPLPAQEKK
jgi:hypothetical protein